MGNIHDTETDGRAMLAWLPRSAALTFFVHASTDMYNESCARRLYEARIHGRGLPAWYGGVALKAPQKRRGGSACECRPEKVSLRRVYWGHAGPTAWRGHHGSPHA